MQNIVIVAVGYNRPDSMQQLLESVNKADYCSDKVDLVVSVDKGKRQEEVVSVAEKFNWNYGNKKIRKLPEKVGLRKHILMCGDLTETYDGVIVLEDDLLVSKAFYKYAKGAVEFYNHDEHVAGISLYSYNVNEFSFSPFTPAYNGYDTFYLQVAQSWGQCWTKDMWSRFRNWEYADAEELPIGGYMPQRIFNWGKTSWKKNYMAYLAQENLYFVYPYHSYSTNRSEIGEHREDATSDFQVALVEDASTWRFADFNRSIKYDIFYERVDIKKELSKNNKKVCLDLYGLRTEFDDNDILISSKRRPYKLIKEIDLAYRPIEQNCIIQQSGKGLFVYDLHAKEQPPREKNDNRRCRYDYMCLTCRQSVRLAIDGIKKKLLRFCVNKIKMK